MQDTIRKFGRYVFFSLPVQLVLLHLKKHFFFTLLWVLLFVTVTQNFASGYGIPLLLLDPEYLGQVGFFSFLIVGFAMGGFITAWNVCMYMLNSYRFQFLASVHKPFVRFCLNNILIPAAFSITYIICLILFQKKQGLAGAGQLWWNIAGLLLGNVLNVLVYVAYFTLFDHDVESFIERLSDKARQSLLLRKINLDKLARRTSDKRQWRIDSYFLYPWKTQLVRGMHYYDERLVEEVLGLHHRNAFVIILISILFLIGLGLLVEYPFFRIPAGASLFLLLIVVMIFVSLATYWFRGWRTLAILVLLGVLNLLTQYGLVIHKHQLYGLNYTEAPKDYTNESVINAISRSMVNADIAYTKNILNARREKLVSKYDDPKPKLVFINVAGGGLKAGYWAFQVLQEADRMTGGKLFEHTILISGASGGMLGAAYYRELCLRKLTNFPVDPGDTDHLDGIGKDLLNGVTTSIATNDIFYPWRKYDYAGYRYKKDRGYMFDKELNENTGNVLDKLLMDYKEPEAQAKIPLMVIASTIINDQRFMLMSPQPIGYLVKPYVQNSKGFLEYLSADGIEFMRFFEDRGAQNLRFTDALRINATYPYIMPAVYLPTRPEIKVMDAGIRENTGLSLSTRFYSVFKDWIDQHTDGIIFLQIRVDDKLKDLRQDEKQTYISEFLSPLGSIFSNLIVLQDYNSDLNFAYLENASKTDISILNFEYKPSRENDRASMSWHLTAKEKQDIRDAFQNEKNQYMLRKLQGLLH